jgi:hypothetical protein
VSRLEHRAGGDQGPNPRHAGRIRKPLQRLLWPLLTGDLPDDGSKLAARPFDAECCLGELHARLTVGAGRVLERLDGFRIGQHGVVDLDRLEFSLVLPHTLPSHPLGLNAGVLLGDRRHPLGRSRRWKHRHAGPFNQALLRQFDGRPHPGESPPAAPVGEHP